MNGCSHCCWYAFRRSVTGNLATYAKQAQVVHLEIDAAEIVKTSMLISLFWAITKPVWLSLTPLIEYKELTDWKTQFAEHMQTEIKQLFGLTHNQQKKA